MKKTKFIFISLVASFSAFVLFNNPTNVSASGVAKTGSNITHLYTKDGSLITNRLLGPSTSWAVGDILKLNGNTYYQVATNEYLNSSDASYENKTIKNNIVVTPIYQSIPLYNDETKSEDGYINYGSYYKVDRVVVNKYGRYYYRVSNHDWIEGDMIDTKGNISNLEHIDDFNPMENAKFGPTIEEEKDILISMGADPGLVDEIPGEFLKISGILSYLSGGDAGSNYRRVARLYQLQY